MLDRDPILTALFAYGNGCHPNWQERPTAFVGRERPGRRAILMAEGPGQSHGRVFTFTGTF
jgi:hypothetical protein